MIDLLQTGIVATQISDATRGQIQNALPAAAGNFLAAGGRLSLSEWASLSEESRRALVAAQDRLEYDRACLIAAMIVRFQNRTGSPQSDPASDPTSGPSASAAARERAAIAAELAAVEGL